MSLRRENAIEIARQLAGSPNAEVVDAGIVGRWNWVIHLVPFEDDICVDDDTGQARWARMTIREWELATDPHALLLIARRRVDPGLFWQLICVLGHRYWDRLRSHQEQFAIITTEEWLAGQKTVDDLWLSWFHAIGSGAERESGWSIADEWLYTYGAEVMLPNEVCEVIRKVMGNPVAARQQ